MIPLLTDLGSVPDTRLQWWRVRGVPDDLDHQGRLFARLERRGCKGFCVANESEFERKRMWNWLVQHCPKGSVHWGHRETCEGYHASFGHYVSISRCVWMPDEQQDGFNLFLRTLPAREHSMLTGSVLDPLVKRLLRGQNHTVVSGGEHGDAMRSVLTVQTFPRLDQLKVLCALTQ